MRSLVGKEPLISPQWPGNLSPMLKRLSFCLPLLFAAPVLAASSDWHESEGGAVRLVTSGLPDAEGRLRGVIDIKLKPGWKTYWRNPGAAGIPPVLDLSRSPHITKAEIEYPAPERVHEGETSWAGYKHSVRLPVTFTLDRPDAVALIDADVLLGLCEAICIPFQASFAFDPGAGADNQADAFAVQAAYAALPAPATPDFTIASAKIDGKRLLIEANLPPELSGQPELFIDHEKPHLLGTPALVGVEGGKTKFTVEILGADASALAESWLTYTLAEGGRAVSGRVQLR